MKKILTLLSFLVFATSGYSQYIEIDNYFIRKELKILAPECFDAQDRLDTTCTKLQEIESFFASDDELAPNGTVNEDLYNEIYGEENPYTLIFSVNGLQYLTNLQGLGLMFGNSGVSAERKHLPKKITGIYAAGIAYFEESYNGFSIEIPESVQSLSLSGSGYQQGGPVGCDLPPGSQLESIYITGSNGVGGIMNTKVKRIYSDGTNIFSGWNSSFKQLPSTVEEIHFSDLNDSYDYNPFNSKMPLSLPSIKKISFDEVIFDETTAQFSISNYTTLEEISFISSTNYPALTYPQNLKKITFDRCYNDLNSGGECVKPNINLNFPEGLVGLNISNFPNLDIIPSVFPQNLQELTLSNMGLSALTDIPSTLKSLNISNNGLEILETFPTQLEILNVAGNTNLKCLPTLPASLKSINVSATKIECIPNETEKIKSTIPLPLCPNSCGETPDLISGVVFLDGNKNGVYEYQYEPIIQGAFIHVNEKIVSTNSSGVYRFYADTDIENKISVTYNHPHLDKILPAQRTYTNSGNSVRVDTMNFAVQLKDVKDLEVLIAPIRARTGSTSQVYITVTNRGTVFVNKFNLSLHPPLDWTIKNTSPVAQSMTDSILWNNRSLSVGQSNTYIANLTIPASTPINSPYSITAKLHQITDDVNLENNTNTYSSFITGSYDPNDKLVTPEILAPNYAEGTELIYTVRFQNTGNDTAFNVVVLDTILEHLDPLTLRVIGKSHKLEWYLNENRQVTFNFNNINLPDSNVNEAASHGFVTFAIQPLPNLASGTIFDNRAAIYFDFNTPIITNYATSKVDIITAINEKNALQLNVYPNPTKDVLNIRWKESGKTNLSISDISGKVIFQSVEIGNYKHIPTQNLSKGMYIIQIQNEQGLGISKIIVQ
jgi:hypothetical protein